jgi:hypothetical protein
LQETILGNVAGQRVNIAHVLAITLANADRGNVDLVVFTPTLRRTTESGSNGNSSGGVTARDQRVDQRAVAGRELPERG